MKFGMRTAGINLGALSPIEVYLSNVCVLSSPIVPHAALRDLDFSGHV